MDKLHVARLEINEIDKEMAGLFEKRMQAASVIADYKKSHGLSILDKGREDEIIKKNSEMIENETVREYYVEFLKNNMQISRSYQSRLNNGLRVAYSGVEGAFANIAAQRIFPASR